MKKPKPPKLNSRGFPIPEPSYLFAELALRDRKIKRATPKQFDPSRVGQSGYPLTLEAWEANREQVRQRGLANKGIVGRRVGWTIAERKEYLDNIAQEARHIMDLMKKRGLTLDDVRAEDALLVAIEVMKDRLGANSTPSARLAAAKLVLEFTKSKPAAKSDVTIRRAEDWLSEIAGEE